MDFLYKKLVPVERKLGAELNAADRLDPHLFQRLLSTSAHEGVYSSLDAALEDHHFKQLLNDGAVDCYVVGQSFYYLWSEDGQNYNGCIIKRMIDDSLLVFIHTAAEPEVVSVLVTEDTVLSAEQLDQVVELILTYRPVDLYYNSVGIGIDSEQFKTKVRNSVTAGRELVKASLAQHAAQQHHHH